MTDTHFSLTAVVNEFPAPSQTFIQRKLLGLKDAGVDVTVAASRFTEKASAIDFKTLPLTPWREAGRILDQPTRAALAASARAALSAEALRGGRGSIRHRALPAPLIQNGADIVHFEFSGIAVTYLDALSRLRPSKIAVSCRGTAERVVPRRDPRRGPQLREVFEQVDLIHCVSDDIRRTVEGLGAPSGKILVNRPAIPVAEFSALAASRESEEHPELRILSIGRLHWAKGYDDAIRVISALVRAGQRLEYRIAGEGAEREKIAFLIEEYGLGENVKLLGKCDQNQIREQLIWADAFLLPSLSEGISNAVLEAMSSGLPVVSTSCGGMGEVIDTGVDGYLVEAGDFDAMGEHLLELAADPDLRRTVGKAAMRRAEAEFDISRQIAVFLANYTRLLST